MCTPSDFYFSRHFILHQVCHASAVSIFYLDHNKRFVYSENHKYVHVVRIYRYFPRHEQTNFSPPPFVFAPPSQFTHLFPLTPHSSRIWCCLVCRAKDDTSVLRSSELTESSWSYQSLVIPLCVVHFSSIYIWRTGSRLQAPSGGRSLVPPFGARWRGGIGGWWAGDPVRFGLFVIVWTVVLAMS